MTLWEIPIIYQKEKPTAIHWQSPVLYNDKTSAIKMNIWNIFTSLGKHLLYFEQMKKNLIEVNLAHLVILPVLHFKNVFLLVNI